MTYCVGLKLNRGLVMMSDTRTNAGVDNISVFRKMFLWEAEGERSITLMTAGNLATTQAVVSLLNERALPADERGAPSILEAPSMFQAARLVGETLREVIAQESGVRRPAGRQSVFRHPDPWRSGAGRRAAALPDLSRGQFRRGRR
jgi:putative proteasome-type protease